jgi:hypothetical protein
VKYEKDTFIVTRFSKLCQGVDKFKRNNFPFGKNFKFQMDFGLKIQESKEI